MCNVGELGLSLETLGIYRYIKDYLDQIALLEMKKGEYVFRADKENDTLYYILEGVVKVENVSYNGKKLVVDIAGEHNFMGAISNLHNANFQCSGVAMTDVKMLVLRKPLMDKLMRNEEFAAFFYQTTSKRVYSMYKKMLARSLFSQSEIMAHYILENAVDNMFVYKSIYDICETLGISRRGIYNILHRFEEIGALEKYDEQSVYIILNEEYLRKIAAPVIDFVDVQVGGGKLS